MVSRKKSKKKSKRGRKRVLDGGEPITIVIKLLGGKTHISNIDPDNTIESIISECREISPIDEKEFKYVLTFGSIILSDWSKTISDYGIRNESRLHLTTKKLPSHSPFCGLYAFRDYDQNHNMVTSVLILNDDNTGHHIALQSQNSVYNTYTNDVVWIHSNNILKILIMTKPKMDNRAIVRHSSRQVFFINTTKYFGYYNVKKYISSPSVSFPDEYKRKDFVFEEEPQIEFLNNFNPLIHSLKIHSIFGHSNQKLLRISIDDREFEYILEDMIHYANMFFLEHIIKILRYMDKGVLSEVFKFDNPENMKKSIEMMFGSHSLDLFSRSPDDSCRKELLAIIGRIPEMDIFN